ncbi:hypothetical protein QP938_13110 [Porticoccaceae bacterium LTM1]|nr:hypothetical protein QP938_13110 [Porticoccaceae bacterium LTM1]
MTLRILVYIASLVLSGCIYIPIPGTDPLKDEESWLSDTPEVSRRKVLLQLGEPIATRLDEKILIYHDVRLDSFWIVGAGYSGAAGAGYDASALVVIFDDQGQKQQHILLNPASLLQSQLPMASGYTVLSDYSAESFAGSKEEAANLRPKLGEIIVAEQELLQQAPSTVSCQLNIFGGYADVDLNSRLVGTIDPRTYLSLSLAVGEHHLNVLPLHPTAPNRLPQFQPSASLRINCEAEQVIYVQIEAETTFWSITPGYFLSLLPTIEGIKAIDKRRPVLAVTGQGSMIESKGPWQD